MYLIVICRKSFNSLLLSRRLFLPDTALRKRPADGVSLSGRRKSRRPCDHDGTGKRAAESPLRLRRERELYGKERRTVSEHVHL